MQFWVVGQVILHWRAVSGAGAPQSTCAAGVLSMWNYYVVGLTPDIKHFVNLAILQIFTLSQKVLWFGQRDFALTGSRHSSGL